MRQVFDKILCIYITCSPFSFITSLLLFVDVTPVFYGSGSTNAPDPASLTEGLPINIPQTAGSVLMTANQIASKIKSGIDKLINKHGLKNANVST